MKRRSLVLLLAGVCAAGLFADDRKKSGTSTETPPQPVPPAIAPQPIFWPPLPAATPAVGEPRTAIGFVVPPPIMPSPDSWKHPQGPGTPGYIHKGIGQFVMEGRAVECQPRMAEREVSTRMIILTVSDEWFEKSGLARAVAKLPTTSGVPACVIANLDAHALVTRATEDGATDTKMTPTLTTFSGQVGSIAMADTQLFTTSLTAKSHNGQTVLEPKAEKLDVGMTFEVVPTVSADGKSVRLVVSGKCSQHTVLPVPLSPVTTLVPAVAVGGKPAGEPVPFTQFIESPKISVRQVKADAVVPAGRTVLMYGGSDTVVQTTDSKAVKAGKRKLHLVVLATPEVVDQPMADNTPNSKEEWQRFWANNQPSCLTYEKFDGDKLSKLMADYRQACAAGKTDDARRLAMECLVLDPTCFSKK